MEKPNAWHASACLNSGHRILTFLLDTLSSSQHVKAYEDMPESNPAPVYRLTFTPAKRQTSALANITVRKLYPDEVTDIQHSKATKTERAGFLPMRWVQKMRAMKTKYA